MAEKNKLNQFEEMAERYTRCDSSAGVAIGEDLRTCIENHEIDGERYESSIEELGKMLEGELDTIIEIAREARKEVKRIASLKDR